MMPRITSEITQSITECGKSNTDKTPKNIALITIADIANIWPVFIIISFINVYQYCSKALYPYDTKIHKKFTLYLQYIHNYKFEVL